MVATISSKKRPSVRSDAQQELLDAVNALMRCQFYLNNEIANFANAFGKELVLTESLPGTAVRELRRLLDLWRSCEAQIEHLDAACNNSSLSR
jgi:hypothetical protein